MKNFWTNISNIFRKVKMRPLFIIAFSFMLAIIIGSILLYCPFALNPGKSISYIDALFTSTSATCVTGLVSIKEGVAETFSLAGRIIIAILIQLGGLGVTTLAVIIFMIANKRLTFNEQSIIKESWNLKNYQGIRTVFLKVILVSFSFELFGAFLSFFDFYYISNLGNWTVQEAVGYAFFHSVSAFNNAGFDLFGTTSMIAFQNDIYINLVTAFLIISGGLGFLVIIDMVSKKFNFKKFSLHTKIVVTFTLILIVLGTLVTFFTEWANSEGFFVENAGYGFLGSYFLSVSTRTAGFTTYDLSKFRDVTLIIYMALMFVGASPGGTGGGIKTTTFALFIAYMRGILTDKRPYFYRRSISKDLIRKALLIIILGSIFVLLGATIIIGVEGNLSYLLDGERYDVWVEGGATYSAIDHAFEAMSAFGTVGLSTGFTPYYHTASKVVLISLMYIGRLGPLTVSTVFKAKNPQLFRYDEEDVSIG